ncbi:malto-oligosyltrehalose synthase [Fibrella aquatilis]|uniref:Malto-oligosyltrehalose synthase n=1 Tax=Fibrella aquatilis TaxID=2817059 RepID=A0A939G8N1_9BACT|nr:malto-oligosyltrehalose synthase [Fibrella aquatilis]MBO0932385.1 malto-oligosyltrehalose synthase [Fibrella aquatilis]
MYNPVATYRVQLHEKFTFADLEKRLAYLQKLGVTTLYASPTLAATPGSTHGYDGIDPQRINPEIGTVAQLRAIGQGLKAQGMGWLQDIVPNHLAYHPANPWITDVLEKGHQSLYAGYFDIPGTNELMSGTLMAPFLGKPLMAILEAGELKVAYGHQRLVLAYYDTHFPLAPYTYATVLRTDTTPPALSHWLDQIEGLYSPEATHPLRSFDYDSPQQAYEQRDVPGALTQAQTPAIAAEPATRWDAARLELAALMSDNEAVRTFVEGRLAQLSQSLDDLHALAEAQHYRLCDGDETRRRINFRRFFTVNGLICLAVERPEVFTQVHSLIQELVDDGTFQGLRVDHVDGLFDPAGYLDSLRKTMGEDPYIVVEKILEPGEELPKTWPIQGTSGYEYLALVNNLLTDPQGETPFTDFYNKLTQTNTPLHDQIRSRKAYILYHDMGGELANLLKFFHTQDLVSPDELTDVNPTMLMLAIGELLVQCPVYRYYGNQFPLTETEANDLRALLADVRNRAVELEKPADLLEKIWLEKPQTADDEYNSRALRFYQRCMQFTGPLMAKGVEDTLLYTYFRFIGHNEVGDSPEAFGMSQAAFHQAMQDRQQHWPLALNGTSTHDTKRGEDVRARLNVLTALGDEWTQTAQRWLDQTADVRHSNMPDVNDAYFILQTVVGAYPYAERSTAWADEENFAKRLRDYVTKALQEAKRNTNWVNPNKAYMDAAHAYIDTVLDKNGPIWPEMADFLALIADFGIVNSLAQVLLKFTTPGVPDVYQGCELFDLSLVDPDNRRAVNYDLREQLLAEVTDAGAQPMTLWNTRTTGQIKLWLTQKLLTERRSHPDFWANAAYVPLTVSGTYSEHILAFARQHNGVQYVTIVPLHLPRLTRDNPLAINWQDTRVILPSSSLWTDILTGKMGNSAELSLSELFSNALPMALVRVG